MINGSATSGKDTLCDLIAKHVGSGAMVRLSSISSVKEFATALGCNPEQKTDEARQLWSDIKDAWTRYNDGPYVEMTNRADKAINGYIDAGVDIGIVSIMCREPEEIGKIVDFYGSGMCKTILVRQDLDHIPGNHADQNVNDYDYDYVIENNGDLVSLEGKVKNLLDNLF